MCVYTLFWLVTTCNFPLTTLLGDGHATLPLRAVDSEGRSRATRGKSAVHIIAVVDHLQESCLEESLHKDPD